MTNTGGPAFPLHNHGVQTLGLHITGMTLRDYFAAKAMQAWVQSTTKQHFHNGEYHVDHVAVDRIAKTAYEMADAMLKARND
jgi:hypothetical protein